MNVRKATVGLVLAAMLAIGAWFSWRWYTTPTPPAMSFDGLGQEVRERIEAALADVRRRPRSAEAWGELSLILVANKQFEYAVPCLTQTARLDPGDPRWPYWHGRLRQGSPEAISLLRRALTLTESPDYQSAILFRLARSLIEDDQLDEAAQRLEALAAIDPKSPALRYGLGLLAIARKDDAAAREHLITLLDNPFARRHAHALLATITKGEEAIEYSRKAANLHADVPWITAIDADTRQYAVDPEGRLARFYELGRAGQPGEALAFLQELAAKSPDEEVCFALGYTLLSMNRLDESEAQLRKVLDFNPHNVKANLLLGIALFEKGAKRAQDPQTKEQAVRLLEQAVAAQDKALKLQPTLGKAHLNRGLALKHLGRMDESLRSIRQAVQYGANSVENHLALGETLAEAGQVDEALEHLQNAVRLADAQDARPRKALEKWQAKVKTPN